jgi:phage protein D
MGLTRKLMSMSTLGAVDFRSDKERIASYTKQQVRATETQTAVLVQQATMQLAEQRRQAAAMLAAQQAMLPPLAPPAIPAGWYPDPQVPGMNRGWDGVQWTAACLTHRARPHPRGTTSNHCRGRRTISGLRSG